MNTEIIYLQVILPYIPNEFQFQGHM